MRVVLERSNLLKSLNHVHRVVERRNTIPILSNVLLDASGAELRLKATDLDLEITESVPATGERPGATTVSTSEPTSSAGSSADDDGASELEAGAMLTGSGRSLTSITSPPPPAGTSSRAGIFTVISLSPGSTIMVSAIMPAKPKPPRKTSTRNSLIRVGMISLRECLDLVPPFYGTIKGAAWPLDSRIDFTLP